MATTIHRYFILHKPPEMVSQFISPHKVRLLDSLSFPFPEGTHAIGRLDKNSEGLLLLTTNKKITKLLFESEVPHRRTYLVQLKKQADPKIAEQLCNGVEIRVKGGGYYTTLKCATRIIEQSDIKYHLLKKDDYRPTSWVEMTLTEGKFHQVRKMVAAVEHQCKRLIRVAIEDLTLGSLNPGEVKEISEEDFFTLLKIGSPE